ncbi:FecCD family ABC transporter permease [Pimelobacter simplex]|uniref:FecCD family ABC transporter permease n=1 Tax=Nocardioides simplex TaxID=2045 RepID=UPI00366DE7F4
MLRSALGIAGALTLLVAAVVLSLAVGARAIPPLDVLRALLGLGDRDTTAIVGDLRVGRTVLGLLCGAALGVAGVLMQALTRNPVADPGILGVNAGAALGVVVGIVLTGALGAATTLGFALVGAGVATTAVFVLASSAAVALSPVRLTLAGVAMAAVLTGITHALVLVDEQVLDTYRYWQVGSLTARRVGELGLVVPVVVGAALGLALVLARSLDVLALGEDAGRALGIDPDIVRAAGLVLVTVLCGTATALAGPISFVGLVVPHAVRLAVGPDLRRVMAISLLTAPALLIAADVVGRVVGRGAEVPVGIVAAFVGAPVLVGFVLAGRRLS